MHQHASGAIELVVALDEQEMETVMGGDGTLWRALGAGIGYVAGQLLNAAEVAQNPMSAAFVYHLYGL